MGVCSVFASSCDDSQIYSEFEILVLGEEYKSFDQAEGSESKNLGYKKPTDINTKEKVGQFAAYLCHDLVNHCRKIGNNNVADVIARFISNAQQIKYGVGGGSAGMLFISFTDDCQNTLELRSWININSFMYLFTDHSTGGSISLTQLDKSMFNKYY